MRDGDSRTRENHQRLASTPMLMKNGEDNGEEEDGAGNYLSFILNHFCFVFAACCAYIRRRSR